MWQKMTTSRDTNLCGDTHGSGDNRAGSPLIVILRRFGWICPNCLRVVVTDSCPPANPVRLKAPDNNNNNNHDNKQNIRDLIHISAPVKTWHRCEGTGMLIYLSTVGFRWFSSCSRRCYSLPRPCAASWRKAASWTTTSTADAHTGHLHAYYAPHGASAVLII